MDSSWKHAAESIRAFQSSAVHSRHGTNGDGRAFRAWKRNFDTWQFLRRSFQSVWRPKGYLFRDSSDSVFNPFHNFVAMRYFGISRLPQFQIEKLREAGTQYPAEVTDFYLQLPQLDPRIPELAKSVTAQAQTPVDKAIALESYLQSKYSYTLQLTSKQSGDPLARFLFETRAGHCEYFASAMAVMLRTLGIPSREVNGFLPGEYNELGEDYIVRA